MKILIVEDEPLIANDIEITLQEAGYTVVGIAHTGMKAMDIVSRNVPDLVLLDISLKGQMSGIDIAQTLKSKAIPFLFVTSHSDQETLRQAGATLPYGYIVKPFKDRDILSNVEIALLRYQNEMKKTFPSHQKINTKLQLELSNREYEVLHLLWEGKTNKQISKEIYLSINTIKSHISRLFLKMEVNSRSAALVKVRAIM